MIKEAIQKEMKFRGDKVPYLAKEIGTTTAQLYNWFNKDKLLRLDKVEKILKLYNFQLVNVFEPTKVDIYEGEETNETLI